MADSTWRDDKKFCAWLDTEEWGELSAAFHFSPNELMYLAWKAGGAAALETALAEVERDLADDDGNAFEGEDPEAIKAREGLTENDRVEIELGGELVCLGGVAVEPGSCLEVLSGTTWMAGTVRANYFWAVEYPFATPLHTGMFAVWIDPKTGPQRDKAPQTRGEWWKR